MDFKDVEKLMANFNDSEMRELEIKVEDFEIRLSKNEISQSMLESMIKPQIIEPKQTINAVESNAKASEEKHEDEAANVIKSPMVGTVYLQPEPNKPQFLTVGSQVKKGDVVCIIEAMKMMTEIKSEFTGIVTEVLVSNEELVEFDQPLFKVKEG